MIWFRDRGAEGRAAVRSQFWALRSSAPSTRGGALAIVNRGFRGRRQPRACWIASRRYLVEGFPVLKRARLRADLSMSGTSAVGVQNSDPCPELVVRSSGCGHGAHPPARITARALLPRLPRPASSPGTHGLVPAVGSRQTRSRCWSCVTSSRYCNTSFASGSCTGRPTDHPGCPRLDAAPDSVAVVRGHSAQGAAMATRASGEEWRRWRRQRGSGRPPMGPELVELIVRLGRENRSWG
jgi:hypothetical protein